MKLLDRLRGSSAKKDWLKPSGEPTQQKEILSSADTSPAEDSTPRNIANHSFDDAAAAADDIDHSKSTPTTPKDKHFSWGGLRRKRKDSHDEEGPAVAATTAKENPYSHESIPWLPDTPQDHDVYIEDGGTPPPPRRHLSVPQDSSPQQPHPSGLKAKNLFVSTIAPVVEPPSFKAASLFKSLSPTSPAEIPSRGTETDEPSMSDDEVAWDYEHDIPLFVDEEDHPIVHRILMMQSPKRLRLSTPVHDDHDDRTIVNQAVAALDKAGNELFAKGLYEDAYLRYERALLLKHRTLDDHNDAAEQTESSNAAAAVTGGGRLGFSSQRHNNLQAAGISDVDVKSSSKDDKSTILASVATSINNITYIKQKTGQATPEETMASYLKSLQIKRDILGPDHLSIGKTLNNIGSVFFVKKEYEPALTAYNDAYRIMEARLGPEHLDVATVVSNIGDVYFALGNKKRALEQYTRALDIRWTKLEKQDEKVARLLRQIAFIETGKLPTMEACALEGCDDPEEEEVVHDMERHQMSVFIEDIQQLQREIKEDLHHFDLAERQMEIDMVKDRMRIFREMREIYNASEEFNIEDSLRESIKVIPGLAEQLKRLQNHEYDDVYSEALDNPDAIVENPDMSPVESSLSEKAPDQPPLQEPEAVKEGAPSTTGDGDGQFTKNDLSVAAEEVPAVYVPPTTKETEETTGPTETEEDSSFETAFPVSIEAAATTSFEDQEENKEPSSAIAPSRPAVITPKPSYTQAFRGRVLQNVKHRAQADDLEMQPPEESAKIYSPNERKAALEGVRERLDRLRQERAQRVTWEAADEARTDGREEETRRRSYMFPTIASAAKALTPKKLRKVTGSSYWNRRSTPKSQSSMPLLAEEDT